MKVVNELRRTATVDENGFMTTKDDENMKENLKKAEDMRKTITNGTRATSEKVGRQRNSKSPQKGRSVSPMKRIKSTEERSKNSSEDLKENTQLSERPKAAKKKERKESLSPKRVMTLQKSTPT